MLIINGVIKMEHVNTEDDIDIGNWMYKGPKDFVIKA